MRKGKAEATAEATGMKIEAVGAGSRNEARAEAEAKANDEASAYAVEATCARSVTENECVKRDKRLSRFARIAFHLSSVFCRRESGKQNTDEWRGLVRQKVRTHEAKSEATHEAKCEAEND